MALIIYNHIFHDPANVIYWAAGRSCGPPHTLSSLHLAGSSAQTAQPGGMDDSGLVFVGQFQIFHLKNEQIFSAA